MSGGPRALAAAAILLSNLAGPRSARAASCGDGAAPVVVESRAAVGPEVLGEIALALGDADVEASVAPAPDGVAAAPPACALRLRVGHDDAGTLRVELLRPGAEVMLVREEARVGEAAVLARAVVLARDLLAASDALPPIRGSRAASPPRDAAAASGPRGAAPASPPAPGGDGALPLAAFGASLGAFTGLGVHLATGADDPRILYPMVATGAGVGLGGALLVAGEWEVTEADAWLVVAGGAWPTAAAHLIYEGRFAERRGARSDDERWTFGLVGTTAGLGLTTLGMALRRPTDGDAALVHSGAAYGAALGGLAEYAVRGAIDGIPEAGLGYGAAAGWLAAGTLALHVDLAPADVLAADLGAALGGLGGAALASPLVFDHPDPTAQRAFLAVAAGATLAGAGLGVWLRPRSGGRDEPLSLGPGRPGFGVLGESVAGDRRAPIVGASYVAVLR